MPNPGEFSVEGLLKGCSKVVQIVVATHNQVKEALSPTYVPTGLQATITPTSLNNKVLILVFQNGLFKENDVYGALRLQNNGGVTLAFIEANFGYTGSAQLLGMGGTGIVYLDSPNSIAPQTYSTEFNSSPGPKTNVQRGSATSSMLLVELLP